jgi:eukaryotic-like serine/threonine-protein kinase
VKLKLSVTAGPHQGKEFLFDGHDTFLIGRSKDCHLKLSYDDPYFSRRHFVIEVNPPRCRVLDLNSRNGMIVNGKRVQTAEIQDGDEISAGHTKFKVALVQPEPEQTLAMPPKHVPLDETIDHLTGLQIPGYELREELGRGGMGIVYRALRMSDGMEVAMKTIIPSIGASRRQVDRFLRESMILKELQHPNVVGFHDVGECGPVIYLAMELVVGPDANKVLKERGQMDIKTGVRVMCQMLAGLAHAHEKGFVHRDIKPSNVIIGTYPGGKRIAKLADFGLARVYESSKLSGLTMQGEVGGTPAFMAPEQVTHYREVRPAADQYAAAATLYQLLTNKFMHQLPQGAAQQLIHITTQDPTPITSRRPEIPAPLARAIHRALNREPEDRYPDVMAFRQALLPFG